MSIRRQEALDYHSQGRPGKIQVSPTKPFKNQRDLSLAYTPGVAEPCREIAARPEEAYAYTAKGNLVAVVTNGTAVLGLGNIGPLAGKPVMEGKGILFKTSAPPTASTSKRRCATPSPFRSFMTTSTGRRSSRARRCSMPWSW